jgi:protein arginine N-methyltransferase 1
MLDDPIRMGAYRAAMARAIRPGDTVIDIGTGPGVTALIACQLGAGHVYAIDPNPCILVGERLARANGFEERITFIRGLSTDFTPERPVDVLVSDLRGRLPLHGQHIPSIIDARSRLLKPDGIQIPSRDRLFVGLARDDFNYRRLRRPWIENEFGLDLSSVWPLVFNRTLISIPGATSSVGEGACWAEIDYRSVSSPDASGTVTLEAPEGERVNGLELWFEAEVLDGIRYATSPRDPNQVYGRTLLPLRDEIILGKDEVVDIDLDMRLVGRNYHTRWTVSVRARRGAGPRVRLEHSTFQSVLLDSKELRLRSPLHAPGLTAKRRAARLVLGNLESGLTLGELGAMLERAEPGLFPTKVAAESFVADLLSSLA